MILYTEQQLQIHNTQEMVRSWKSSIRVGEMLSSISTGSCVVVVIVAVVVLVAEVIVAVLMVVSRSSPGS